MYKDFAQVHGHLVFSRITSPKEAELEPSFLLHLSVPHSRHFFRTNLRNDTRHNSPETALLHPYRTRCNR